MFYCVSTWMGDRLGTVVVSVWLQLTCGSWNELTLLRVGKKSVDRKKERYIHTYRQGNREPTVPMERVAKNPEILQMTQYKINWMQMTTNNSQIQLYKYNQKCICTNMIFFKYTIKYSINFVKIHLTCMFICHSVCWCICLKYTKNYNWLRKPPKEKVNLGFGPNFPDHPPKVTRDMSQQKIQFIQKKSVKKVEIEPVGIDWPG